jgi:hypothetical protein
MMEKMFAIGQQPSVNKFRPDQIAQQSTWTRIPEAQRTVASMRIIHIVPSNGSTVTYVNPIDPGDQEYLNAPKTWPSDHKSR